MKGLLVFDHLNDLIYLNCCPRFVRHVRQLASTQGLSSSEHCQPFGKGKMALDPNILIQLFSPLVTSQRFMREQFGNPYTSLQCEDGTNIVFQDFMGFLFLRVGTDEVSTLKRSIGVTITLVTYLCGPDVSLLKSSPSHSKLLDNLSESWNFLSSTDQAIMMEGINQVKVPAQLNSSLVSSLAGVAGRVQGQLGSSLHTLLFLESKLLSWYSSKNAINLGAEDILFLILLCHKTKNTRRETRGTRLSLSTLPSSSKGQRQGRRHYSSGGLSSKHPDSSLESQRSKGDGESESEPESDWDFIDGEERLGPGSDSEGGSEDNDESIVKYAVLFKDDHNNFVPHIVHIGIVQEGLYFVLVSQPPTAPLITLAASAFQQSILFHGQSRGDLSSDKGLFDQIESTVKKLGDLLKKHKNLKLRSELMTRMDRFKLGFQLYSKTKESISVQTMPVVDILRQIFRTYFGNNAKFLTPSPTEKSFLGGNIKTPPLDTVWKQMQTDTEDFWGFLRLKTKSGGAESGGLTSPSPKTSLLMESRENLSINKYLDQEFPGLVHFIYVDRNRHSVILPSVDFSKDETVKLTKTKIWGMVKFARDHMQQGHFSVMWKDSAFNYAYFLWFEDSSGTPIRAKQPATPWEGLLPGIMCGDFYKRLIMESFPNIAPSKIRCVELFCIHLGLQTSACVLEHSKRLATNIFDEYCNANAATDLL